MKSYYLFNPGRMSRKDHTLKFTPVDEEGREGQAKYLPVADVQNLFVFGSLDANSALFNFLGKQQIPVHFFDYYEHYTGSFMPKEYLLSGKMQIAQTRHYLSAKKRVTIAGKLIEGAAFNMLKNLRYYYNRQKNVKEQIETIETYSQKIGELDRIPVLMGLEGNIRQVYYSAFDEIISDFSMGNRSKQPPDNEINTLISFGNMLCYTLCLDQLYHTQLNPTISYLHEPGERRYSLALDLAEVFKPMLVDRLIFSVLNKKQIQAKDFEKGVGNCALKPAARKVFVQAWEEKLSETIQHRSLGRKVSYRHLVRLDCYKLAKHLLNIDEYKPFKIWW
jgi:CRISPR-associated protein Cas1